MAAAWRSVREGRPSSASVDVPPEVLVPVAVAGTAQLVTARTEDGRTVILAFSDEAALRRWRPDGSPWARVRRAELARAASEHRAAGVVIDVAGPSTVELMGEEIDALGREEA